MNQLIDEALQIVNNLCSKTVFKKHHLPPLTYDYAALKPYMDARMMILHHDNHHAGYVKKLNDALQCFPDLHQYSALWLLCYLDQMPNSVSHTRLRKQSIFSTQIID